MTPEPATLSATVEAPAVKARRPSVVRKLLRNRSVIIGGIIVLIMTVIAIAGLRWPMPMVMVAGLMLSGGVAYWRLGRK